MAVPRYKPEQFQPSGSDSGTPEPQGPLREHAVQFIADDFPREKFTPALYLGLSNHGYFRFIAHYNIHGFYAEQMSTPERRTQFLRDLANDCQREARRNRPDLWSYVKLVLARHLLSGQDLTRPRRALAPLNVFGSQSAPFQRDHPILF